MQERFLRPHNNTGETPGEEDAKKKIKAITNKAKKNILNKNIESFGKGSVRYPIIRSIPQTPDSETGSDATTNFITGTVTVSGIHSKQTTFAFTVTSSSEGDTPIPIAGPNQGKIDTTQPFYWRDFSVVVGSSVKCDGIPPAVAVRIFEELFPTYKKTPDIIKYLDRLTSTITSTPDRAEGFISEGNLVLGNATNPDFMDKYGVVKDNPSSAGDENY